MGRQHPGIGRRRRRKINKDGPKGRFGVFRDGKRIKASYNRKKEQQ